MSIIYDALNKDGSPDAAGDSSVPAAASFKKPAGTPFWIIAVIIVLGIGCAGWFARKYQGSVRAWIQKFSRPRTSASGNTVPRARAMVFTPPKAYSSSKPVLEGIIFDGETPIAIINGKVYKTGESAENFIVESIERSQATIRMSKDNTVHTLTF